MSEYTKQLAEAALLLLEMRKLWSTKQLNAKQPNSQTAKQPNVQTVKKTKQSTSKITNKEISENYHNLYLYISNVGIEQQTPVPIPSAQMNGLLLLW